MTHRLDPKTPAMAMAGDDADAETVLDALLDAER
jgi:hypothetical protein